MTLANLDDGRSDATTSEAAFHALDAGLASAAASYLCSPPTLNVVEHTEQFVHLARGSASIPGPIRFSRREVSRGPHLWVTERGVRKITVGVPTQLFKTQLIINVVSWLMHLHPKPMMIVQPRDKDAAKFANRQLMPVVRASPGLTHLIPDVKGRNSDNTKLEKVFPGGYLRVANAGSPAELAGLPMGAVFLDEIDKMAVTIEGDPLSLAEGRMSSFFNSISIRACSFTVPKRTDGGPTVYQELQQSDQRAPFVRCPHCGHDHVMRWKNLDQSYRLRWDIDEGGRADTSTALYYCPGCGAGWDEADRIVALKVIRWRQTRKFTCCGIAQDPERDWCDSDQSPAEHARRWHPLEGVDRARCTECGRLAVSNEHAGGWCNRFYDPNVSLSEFAKKFLNAAGNASKLRAFVNCDLAEAWEDEAVKSTDADVLQTRGETWPIADETDLERPVPVLPDGVAVITVGVDVQAGNKETGVGSRFAVEAVGWGVGEENWSLDYHEAPANTLDVREWDAVLLPMIERVWLRADGRQFRGQAICIDSGNSPDQAYQFVAKHRARLAAQRIYLYAVKGASERAGGAKMQTWAGASDAKAANKWAIKPQLIGTNEAKETVSAHLSTSAPGPGFVHFPDWRGRHWSDGMTSEIQVRVKTSAGMRLAWKVKEGVRNEPLDCRVYALAALRSLQKVHGLNLEKQAAYVGAIVTAFAQDDDEVSSGNDETSTDVSNGNFPPLARLADATTGSLPLPVQGRTDRLPPPGRSPAGVQSEAPPAPPRSGPAPNRPPARRRSSGFMGTGKSFYDQ